MLAHLSTKMLNSYCHFYKFVLGQNNKITYKSTSSLFSGMAADASL